MPTKNKDFDEVFSRLKGIGIKTQQQIADIVGITQSAVADAKKRGSFPKAWAVDIGKACTRSIDWILTGSSPELAHKPGKTTHSPGDEENGLGEELEGGYFAVPMSNGEISAGGGMEPNNSFDFKLLFKEDWLAKKGDPTNMSMIRVSGNSMEPTVQHGDVALINHAVNHIDTPGAIYAIAVDGQISLKRLQMIKKTGQIKVISDNKDYDVDYVDPESVVINGKALWVGRELR